MDELLQRLQGIGLDDNQAKKVLGEVRSFLEQQLPDPIAGKLDDILSGVPESMSSLSDKLPGGDMPKGLGDAAKGLFGR